MALDILEAVQYYRRQGAPGDQTALVSLLREVQQTCGGTLPLALLSQLADLLGVKESYLRAVVKRIPSLHLSGIHTLELCAGPNCSKRAALAAFVAKTYGEKPTGFTLQYVPCMRMCGKGPNIKWDGKLYYQADEALLQRLIGKK